jgi:hypothetical protein
MSQIRKKLIEMLVDLTKACENGYKLQGQQSSSHLVLARSGLFKFCCTFSVTTLVRIQLQVCMAQQRC